MKKTITALLALFLAFGLVACDPDPSPDTGDPAWDYTDTATGQNVQMWIGKNCADGTGVPKITFKNNNSVNMTVTAKTTNYSNPTVWVTHINSINLTPGSVHKWNTGVARDVKQYELRAVNSDTGNTSLLTGTFRQCCVELAQPGPDAGYGYDGGEPGVWTYPNGSVYGYADEEDDPIYPTQGEAMDCV